MTGNISQFDKNGHLTIIDQKKNLVKTFKVSLPIKLRVARLFVAHSMYMVGQFNEYGDS